MESHASTNTGYGLGKLLPKAITSRRRKKHSRDRTDPDFDLDDDDRLLSSSPGSHSHRTASDDALRGTARAHTITTVSSGSASTESRRSRTRSRDNPNMASRNEATSPVSYDSDPDVLGRPRLVSAHPSQIDYLTTPSSIVQDAYLKGSESDAIPRSATLHVSDTTPGVNTSLPAVSTSKTGLLRPQSSSIKRTPSPGGRFREVFLPKKASRTSSSPERQSEQQLESDNRPAIPLIPPTSAPVPESINRPQTAPIPDRARAQSKPGQTRIEIPPRTPPTTDKPAPLIVNTPPTPTDPANPFIQHSPTKSAFTSAPDGGAPPTYSSNVTSSPGSIASTTRRTRAGSNASVGPSKLSNVTLPPLTPTPESGSNGTSGPATSGFFSSVISAAQNAANTLSNTISTANIGTTKNKPGVTGKDRNRDIKDPIEKADEEPTSQPDMSSQSSDQRELAVNTLGQGSLSLSQLGLAEANSTATTPVAARFPELAEPRHRSDSAPAEPGPLHTRESSGDDMLTLPRPISLYDSSAPGDRTPPATSVYEGKSGLQRSGSIRSAIGGAKRRTRGSSAATGTTIGAAISAVTASVGNPSANLSAPKLTGFAVASKKRNRDFHNLFKSVPDDDYLIEDYSCALQREILAHGRLYVSEGHLCFSSNIFGWVTTLVMSFDEIVSVEKRSTALVFKNGLMISTLHAKHVFASFTSRDSTYDLIVNIWKLGHPSLRSSLNGVRLDETGGDKTEKVVDAELAAENATQSGSESEEEESEDGEDVYDEDEDNAGTPDTVQAPDPGPINGDAEKTASRKVSGPALSTTGGADKSKEPVTASPADADFPGPPTHAPTDCGDADTHFDKIMGDDIIPAPLGKVYSMIFGAPTWMSKFLTNDQKCTELQMDEKAGLTLENKSRDYSFIKPLNGPIGPKQTKCNVCEALDNLDFSKAANVTVTTQTPDVPSGNVFNVKTRYCLSWAENNQTRIQMTCTIEWTGKSWLKGPIEKGTIDGQTQYAKDLFAALKLGVASRSRSGTLTNGAAVKPSKRKGKKGKLAQPTSPTAEVEASKGNVKQNWGIFEPVQPFFGPVVDIVKPILTGNVVYGLLVGLLVASWFGFGFPNRPAGGVGRPYGGHDLDYRYYPDRIAVYEEMWRREESELWDWLEERVGLDRLAHAGEVLGAPKRAVEPRTMEERLREDRMDEREVDEAIRVTEEKLKILKEVVEKRKMAASGKAEG